MYDRFIEDVERKRRFQKNTIKFNEIVNSENDSFGIINYTPIAANKAKKSTFISSSILYRSHPQLFSLLDKSYHNLSSVYSLNLNHLDRLTNIYSLSNKWSSSCNNKKQNSSISFLFPNLRDCLSSQSSIVSLNDHKLYLEVSDLYTSELKKQFNTTRSPINTQQTPSKKTLPSFMHTNDSGIDMIDHDEPVSQLNCKNQLTYFEKKDLKLIHTQLKQVKKSKQTNQANGNSYSSLVFFLKTIHSITSVMVKNSAPLRIGKSYLNKLAHGSLNKLNKFANKSTLMNMLFTNLKSKLDDSYPESSTTKTLKTSSTTLKSANTVYINLPIKQAIENFKIKLNNELNSSVNIVLTSSTLSLTTTRFSLPPIRQFLMRLTDINFY
mgnify:CR=1 FL=1